MYSCERWDPNNIIVCMNMNIINSVFHVEIVLFVSNDVTPWIPILIIDPKVYK